MVDVKHVTITGDRILPMWYCNADATTC